jgi:hypothetical protein
VGLERAMVVGQDLSEGSFNMRTESRPDLIVQNNGLTWTLEGSSDRGLQWLKKAAATEEPQIDLEAERGEYLCQRAREAGLIVELNP